MTRDELKRAAMTGLRLDPEQRLTAEAIMDRMLEPFVRRDETVDDGRRFKAVLNRETGHDEFKANDVPPRKVAPYRFTADQVQWLVRGVRRELKL